MSGFVAGASIHVMTRHRTALPTRALRWLCGAGGLLLVACASGAHSTKTASKSGASIGDPPASNSAASAIKSDPASPNIAGVKDVALETVLTSPLQFNHQRVRVHGVVQLGTVTRQKSDPSKLASRGGPICTRLFCTDGTNDCNRCFADVLLTSESRVGPVESPPITLRGERLSCEGPGSKLQCNPPLGSKVEVIGTVEVQDAGEGSNEVSVVLHVEQLK